MRSRPAPWGAQQLTDEMRRWLVRNYPEFAIPSVRINQNKRSDEYHATSDAYGRNIEWYQPRTMRQLDWMGRTGAYQGAPQRQALQVLMHELMHQVGPKYNSNPSDRFWEEGLSERVATDLSPEFARTRKYWKRPMRTYEDGSTTSYDDDFDFTSHVYPENTKAVNEIAFAFGALANPEWAGRENPASNPEAERFLRLLLAGSTADRRRKIRRVKQHNRGERSKPTYARDAARNVGKVVSRASRIPTDSSSRAAHRAGREIYSAAQKVRASTPKPKPKPKPRRVKAKDVRSWF